MHGFEWRIYSSIHLTSPENIRIYFCIRYLTSPRPCLEKWQKKNFLPLTRIDFRFYSQYSGHYADRFTEVSILIQNKLIGIDALE